MTWNIFFDADQHDLLARFEGQLDAEGGRLSAAEFVKHIVGQPTRVIFDIREMTGYEAAARQHWQQALLPHRDNMKEIVIVGGGPLLRLGASMIAVFLRVPLRNIPAEDSAEIAKIGDMLAPDNLDR